MTFLMKIFLCLFFGIILLPFIIAIFSIGEMFYIEADLSKKISIVPYSYPRDFSNNNFSSDEDTIEDIIEINGSYSVKYTTDFIEFFQSDGPLTIRNLHNIEVYSTTYDGLINNTNHDITNAKFYQNSDIQILEKPSRNKMVIIDGYIQIVSDKHSGNLDMGGEATPSRNKGTPTISFEDINWTNSFHSFGNLLPYDNINQEVMVSSINDFMITNYTTQPITSTVFTGVISGLLNSKPPNYVSARPWDSYIEGTSPIIKLSIGVPFKVIIEGESLNSAKLFGFNGKFSINDSVSEERGTVNWEIKGVEFSKIELDVAKIPDTSMVLVEVHFKGKAKDLIINDNSIQSYSERNFFSIWNNSLYQSILFLLLGTILGLWIESRKNN